MSTISWYANHIVVGVGVREVEEGGIVGIVVGRGGFGVHVDYWFAL